MSRPDFRWAALIVFIDTLHPVHEGRLFRWGFAANESALLEYGRTDPETLAASGNNPSDVAAAERWRRSLFYKMLQTGDSLLRLRVNAATADEFSLVPDLLADGMTDYVAMITRFAAEGHHRRNGRRVFFMGDKGA